MGSASQLAGNQVERSFLMTEKGRSCPLNFFPNGHVVRPGGTSSVVSRESESYAAHLLSNPSEAPHMELKIDDTCGWKTTA